MIIPDARILDRSGSRLTVQGAGSAADLEAALDAFVYGTPVEITFEGDPMEYDGTVLSISNASQPQHIQWRVALASAPSRIDLATKQNEFRRRFNRFAKNYLAYLGPTLPSLLDIPPGEEDGAYDAGGTWVP